MHTLGIKFQQLNQRFYLFFVALGKKKGGRSLNTGKFWIGLLGVQCLIDTNNFFLYVASYKCSIYMIHIYNYQFVYIPLQFLILSQYSISALFWTKLNVKGISFNFKKSYVAHLAYIWSIYFSCSAFYDYRNVFMYIIGLL